MRILLADDSPDNRLLIRAYTKKTLYVLTEAENGQIAVERFVDGAYDLVLMDIQMPVLDGYSAIRAIRKHELEKGSRRTRIIALTASALEEDVRRAQQAGCDMHVSKPIKKSTLLDSIDRAIRTVYQSSAHGSNSATPATPRRISTSSDEFRACACSCPIAIKPEEVCAMPNPKAAGLSSARLATLDRFIQSRYIDTGKIPGALTLIARRGEVAHFSALGMADVERKVPVREDTIFRLYSMTKPLTSVAFMMLVEQGLTALDEPVHNVIPEWQDLGVYHGGFMENLSHHAARASDADDRSVAAYLGAHLRISADHQRRCGLSQAASGGARGG